MAKDKEKAKPQPVIVAKFKTADAANSAAQALKEAHKNKEIAYQAYAVVSRDEQKKLHVKETGDVGGMAGMISGGLLGVVIAVLAGPVGWVWAVAGAVTGGAVGGIATKLIDSGVKNEQIKQVGEGLQPGMSAVLVLADEPAVAAIKSKLTAAGGEVATATLAPEVVEQAEVQAASQPAPAASKEEKKA